MCAPFNLKALRKWEAPSELLIAILKKGEHKVRLLAANVAAGPLKTARSRFLV